MIFLSKKLVVPSLGKNASDYAVGDSVYIPVNGTSTEFIVVQQGAPSSLYDSSCDGTWLLMKNIYTTSKMDSTDNDYANSDMHTYLNGTFLGLLSDRVQSKIEQVKIPYQNGTGSAGSVSSGSSGLPTKIFLLGAYEVGWTTTDRMYTPIDGACLSYFSGCSATDTKRIGYYNGTATNWWLRSADTYVANRYFNVSSSGGQNYTTYSTSYGIRPAIIVPFTTKFDEETNVIKG